MLIKRHVFATVQHDSTVGSFLSALNIFNGITPPYAATVLVELFNTDGQYLVKIWYRNDSVVHPEPFLMTIPGKTCISFHNCCIRSSVGSCFSFYRVTLVYKILLF